MQGDASFICATLAAIALAGCSVSPDEESSTPRPAESPAATAQAEAPRECGFPPGTPLIFAGRSTTSALQVQQVIGDPLSNDPADIYITLEEVDVGEVRARQVCAIYVGPAGFVEITPAPEGWDPETGRPPATPPPSATAVPSPPPVAVSEEEAIATAQAAALVPRDWEVNIRAVRLRDVEPFPDIQDWSEGLSPAHPIYVVFLSEGDRGAMVYIDAASGDVLEVSRVIVD